MCLPPPKSACAILWFLSPACANPSCNLACVAALRDRDRAYVRSGVKLRHGGDVRCTTALPPKAEVHPRSCYVAQVPCVDGSELARLFFTLAGWSVQPCVRPVSAVHMTAGHNALRGSGLGQKPAFEMHWHLWVVLIAGSTGSALRAVRPPNLHITPNVGAISVTP
jgi:hypothetical protein